MQIVRDQPDTTKGPAERFTGDVYVDAVVDAPAPARNRERRRSSPLRAASRCSLTMLAQTLGCRFPLVRKVIAPVEPERDRRSYETRPKTDYHPRYVSAGVPGPALASASASRRSAEQTCFARTRGRCALPVVARTICDD